MTKKYIEVTVAYEDDLAINPDGSLETSSREKEGEAGEWSIATETAKSSPLCQLGFSWLSLEIKKE